MKAETRKELIKYFLNCIRHDRGYNRKGDQEVAERWTNDEQSLKNLKTAVEKAEGWHPDVSEYPPDWEEINLFRKAIAENEAERIRKIFTDGLLKCGIPTDEIQKMADIAYPL